MSHTSSKNNTKIFGYALGSPVIDLIAERGEALDVALQSLQEMGYRAGFKYYPEAEEIKRILDLTASLVFRPVHGGTSSNKLANFLGTARALGIEASGALIAGLDNSPKAKATRKNLESYGMLVLPSLGRHEEVKLATTLIFQNGLEKLTFTSQGNAREILDTEHVQAALLEIEAHFTGEGVQFVESALLRKFDSEAIAAFVLDPPEERAFKVFALETHRDLAQKNAEMYFSFLQRVQPQLVTANLEELQALFGESRFEDVVSSYQSRISVPLFLTLGREGACYVDKERIFIPSHTSHKPILSTTGAGDAATGSFVAALRCGCSVEKAGKIAMALGRATAEAQETRLSQDVIMEVVRRV